jgi:tetratricopeptide (TPR) repeat protein
LGELDEAEGYYKKALNIEFDLYAILGLALINKLRGNYEEAVRSLYGLIKSEPKNHRLYTEVADCYLHLNQPDKALEVLAQYQKLGMRNSYVTEMFNAIRSRV